MTITFGTYGIFTYGTSIDDKRKTICYAISNI